MPVLHSSSLIRSIRSWAEDLCSRRELRLRRRRCGADDRYRLAGCPSSDLPHRPRSAPRTLPVPPGPPRRRSGCFCTGFCALQGRVAGDTRRGGGGGAAAAAAAAMRRRWWVRPSRRRGPAPRACCVRTAAGQAPSANQRAQPALFTTAATNQHRPRPRRRVNKNSSPGESFFEATPAHTFFDVEKGGNALGRQHVRRRPAAFCRAVVHHRHGDAQYGRLSLLCAGVHG